MRRIMITGGPCSGKTTALNVIPEWLDNFGYYTVTVPEAATLLITGGAPAQVWARLDRLGITDFRKKFVQFEETLIHTQLGLEEQFAKILKLKTDDAAKRVMVCDRGAIDAASYCTLEEFAAILKHNRWDVNDLYERRYHGVFHLVTAADGQEQYYTLANNPARFENADEARKADQRLREILTSYGHPHFRVIGNNTLFAGKMQRLKAAIQQCLGIPISLEIERKFFVHNRNVSIPVPFSRSHIKQAYLKSEGEERIRHRISKNGEMFYRTFKIPTTHLSVREERETHISVYEYHELMDRRDPARDVIEKDRICFLWKDQYFELDRFTAPDRIKGLVLLEIELTEESEKIELPPWLGTVSEVTDNPKYKNVALAQR